MLLVEPLLEHAFGLEAPQSAREDVARRARVLGDPVEAVDVQGELADDEERPLLAEDGERRSDRAGPREDLRRHLRPSVSERVDISNPHIVGFSNLLCTRESSSSGTAP